MPTELPVRRRHDSLNAVTEVAEPSEAGTVSSILEAKDILKTQVGIRKSVLIDVANLQIWCSLDKRPRCGNPLKWLVGGMVVHTQHAFDVSCVSKIIFLGFQRKLELQM